MLYLVGIGGKHPKKGFDVAVHEQYSHGTLNFGVIDEQNLLHLACISSHQRFLSFAEVSKFFQDNTVLLYYGTNWRHWNR